VGPQDATELLLRARDGDGDAAGRLYALIYDELHAMAERAMRRERIDHTLQPTALANDAFMKLIDQSKSDWRGRAQFLSIAAETMRRILCDHARARKRDKRGGGSSHISLEDHHTPVARGASDDDLLAIDEHLAKLARVNPVGARMIELRYYGGLGWDDVAMILDMPKRTVESKWTAAKAWILARLEESGDIAL